MFPYHLLPAALLAALTPLGPAAVSPPAEPAPPVAERVVQEVEEEELTADLLLERAEAAADGLATLRCRVRYTHVQGLLADEQRRFGDFFYAVGDDETPTRFAVHLDRLVMDDVLRPISQWYIYDGRFLLERNHDDKTATRRELRPEGAADEDELVLDGQAVPIPLRPKKDAILADYDATLLDDETLGDWTLHHLRLTPKPNGGGGGEPIDLWFESETLLLAKVVTTEGEDSSEYLFAPNAMEPNAEIAPGTFDTSLPDATDGWEVQDVPLE